MHRSMSVKRALDSFSAEAVKHATALAPHLENSELAEQLVSATEQFDFERALALLETFPGKIRNKEARSDSGRSENRKFWQLMMIG